MLVTKPVTKVKDTTTQRQGREPGKDIAWKHPRRPAEAETRMKSASRSRTAHSYVRRGSTKNPKQVLKNQSDNPGRVTNWTRPPDHKELRRQRNNSGEREGPAHQNKKAKGAELQPFKAENGPSSTRCQEDTMPCERGVARSNTHTAMPKTEDSVSPPGGKVT